MAFHLIYWTPTVQKYGKLLFFPGATAGLGKYHTGSYGRIGVYRVNCTCNLSLRPTI